MASQLIGTTETGWFNPGVNPPPFDMKLLLMVAGSRSEDCGRTFEPYTVVMTAYVKQQGPGDEYDDEPSPIKAERPGVWRVEAKISVAKLNQQLDLGLPESDEDYETIAGLVIHRFRRIPDRGETLTLPTVIIEVIAATDRAVEAVRVTKLTKAKKK